MTLSAASEHVGHSVLYRSEGQPTEHGYITSVNSRWVFVHYNGDVQSKATASQLLELEY